MGMMDKLLDAMRLNPDEEFDDEELDEEYDFFDDDDDEYDIPTGPSERELRRKQAAEERAVKKEQKRRDKEEAAIARESRSADKEVSRSSSRKAGDEYVYNKKAERQTAGRSSKITPINGRSRNAASGAGWVVRIIKPSTVDDEVEIVDTLLEGRTVIINMEGFDLAIAQRIIDFTIGATYAMGGDLQRISNFIFLATPPGVDISGDINNIKEQYADDEELG